jgi:hypothetical protein
MMLLMKSRIVYIHGNSTTHWSFGWAKWLHDELDRLGYPTFFETFPDSIIARAEYWLPFLEDFVKVGKDDVLLGWSSGAVAALRYAEKHEIKGSVLISPSYTDLGDEFEKQSGYFSAPWDWKNIRKNQQNVALFYGDDDPYIPQKESEYIATKLQPITVQKFAGRKHFIDDATFPEALDYITKNY